MRYVLIDRITDIVPWQSATGLKCVALAEDYFVDHFPERPVMPGVLIVEALNQLCVWLIAASSDFRQTGTLASIRSAKFKKFVTPGTQLQLRVAITQPIESRLHIDGQARVEGKVVTQVQMDVVCEVTAHGDDGASQRQRFRNLL